MKTYSIQPPDLISAQNIALVLMTKELRFEYIPDGLLDYVILVESKDEEFLKILCRANKAGLCLAGDRNT
jgi:hypothetical protein